MEKLRNISVKKRMLISFGMVVAVSSIAAVLGAILLLIVDYRYAQALELNGFIQGDIGHYNSYLNKGGAFARDVIILTDKADIESAQASLAECDAQAEYYFDEFVHKLETEDEQKLVDIIEEAYPHYIEARDRALEIGVTNRNEEALEIFRKEAVPYLTEAMAAADELMAMNVKMGDDISQELTTFSTVLVVIMAVLIIIASIVGMLFARYTALDIAKPLEKIQKAAHKLAEGELDIEVHLLDKNEFGEMAEDFNKATAKLKEYIDCIKWGLTEIGDGDFTVQPTVEFKGDFIEMRDAIASIEVTLSHTMKQINEGADQVSLGAQHMADSAQTLAEGATSQAGAVEELTATIENVTNAAENSAKKADEASQSAERFAGVAEQSSKEMQLLTEAMERITSTSREIEGIIGEIEDIASQTNLLSLNASIEAARAGEAGRGFAVVADQIGKLAADSAQSAVNTKNLIVKALQEINNGNEITARTTEALGEVIDGIKFLADASKETSRLSKEQADTMVQVQQGVEQIADVVQNNSAAAQESSATSQELSAQSQNLKAMVDQFNLLDV